MKCLGLSREYAQSGSKKKIYKGGQPARGNGHYSSMYVCVCRFVCVWGGLCSGEHVRMRVNFSSVSLKVAKCLSAT